MREVRVITIGADELRELIRGELEAVLEARSAPSPAPPPTIGSLTVAQAARRAGCSVETIYRWIGQGVLTERRVGTGRGHYRIDPGELEAAMRREREAKEGPVDVEEAAVAILGRRR